MDGRRMSPGWLVDGEKRVCGWSGVIIALLHPWHSLLSAAKSRSRLHSLEPMPKIPEPFVARPDRVSSRRRPEKQTHPPMSAAGADRPARRGAAASGGKPSPGQPERLAAPPPAPASPVDEDAPASARGRGRESEKLTINLGAVDLGSIDLLVGEGFFSNRSDLIRTAVRKLLADHRDIINGALARQERTLGLRRITRAELEALREAGRLVRIGVVGLAVIDPDVSPELARATIAGLSVLGSLQASAAVRKALAGRLG